MILINHTYVMKPPPNPKGQDSEILQVGEYVEIWVELYALKA